MQNIGTVLTFKLKKVLTLKQADYRNFRYMIGNLKYDLSLKFSQCIFVPHVLVDLISHCHFSLNE